MTNKIDVEIEEIENGWLIEDSYFGEMKFFKTYAECSNEANKRFIKFQKDIEGED